MAQTEDHRGRLEELAKLSTDAAANLLRVAWGVEEWLTTLLQEETTLSESWSVVRTRVEGGAKDGKEVSLLAGRLISGYFVVYTRGQRCRMKDNWVQHEWMEPEAARVFLRMVQSDQFRKHIYFLLHYRTEQDRRLVEQQAEIF